MSNDFKEFILKNKKLEFNNPQNQQKSLDKLQKFLNKKMEIDINAKIINESKEKIKEENEKQENKKEIETYNQSKNRRSRRFKTEINLNFLKATTVASVEDVAKMADIDLGDVNFWRSSLEIFKQRVEMFLELAAQ